jgi:hypothetical protein
MYDVDQLLMNVELYSRISDNRWNLFGLAFVLRRDCAGFLFMVVREFFGISSGRRRVSLGHSRTTPEQSQKQTRRKPGTIRNRRNMACLQKFITRIEYVITHCSVILPTSWQTDGRLVLHFSRFFPLSPVKTGRSPGGVLDESWTRSGQPPKKL